MAQPSPRVSEYRQQTAPSESGGAGYTRPVDTSAFGGAGGISANEYNEAAANLHRAAVSINESDKANAHAWASNAVAKARLDWTTDLVKRQELAPPGAPDFTKALIEDFDKYSEKVIETAPNELSKNYLRDRLNSMRTGLSQKSMVFEAQARVDYRSDQFTQAVDHTAKLMNTDPSQFDEALAERVAEIDSSPLPPVKKSALRQTAIDKIATAATWSMIQRSPEKFLQDIGFGSDANKPRRTSGDLNGVTGVKSFDILPFEKRVQMFESAIKLKAQIGADSERAAKAAAEKLGDDALKEGWNRLYNGKLDRAYIEQIRPLLKPSEYHSLLEARKKGAEGGGAKTDPGTFRELQRLIYSDPKEAEAFAFKAHRNGLLSNEHLSSGLSRSRELDRTEGPKSEYERSRRYIAGTLDPGPMVNDPVKRERMAEAMDDFDRWVEAGKGKRTDKEIQEYGREVVNRYKLVDLSDTALALPSPRSGQIRRNPQDRVGMQQDLARAAAEAERRKNSGQLSPGEYAAEMVLLNRWRKTIEGGKK